MRQDGGKLKEVQVRLFLSSRAEMQEVIETARQTTLSLMQIQRQQQVPAVVAAATAVTHAPQIIQPMSTAIQPQIPMILSATTPMLAAQQQLYPAAQLAVAVEKPESSSGSSKRRSKQSRSRSRSRSRDRYRRRSSRSRSRSPKSRRNRSHRDRSDSRDRERRRSRPSRFDKDSSSGAKSSTDKRFNVADHNGGAANANAINPQMYQQNAAAFATNGTTIQPFLVPNQIDQSMQQNHLGAFSTNDVRKMNLAMHSNPLAFSQMYAQQQQQQNVAASAFSTFSSNMAMPNQMAMGALNPMALSNGIGNSGSGDKVVHCVRIRNLCNFTNYSSIRKFFSGLSIPNDGIKLIHDQDGNRTGQAYVRFVRPHNVVQAIGRSNQKLGRNSIVIQELDDKTYDEAIDAYRPPRRNNYRSDGRARGDRDRDRRDDGRRSGRRRGDYSDSNDDYDDEDRNGSSKGNSENERDNEVMCISDSEDSKEKESAPFTTVLIEDLPPFTKEQDIMKMFSSYSLVHIVMAKRPKMFSSYVRFHNAEDARAAVKNTSCHKISFKTVYVSACCEQEYETARREFSGDVDFELSSPKANDAPKYSDYRKAEAEMSNEIKSPDPSSETQNDTDSSTNQNDDEPPKLSLEGIPGVNLADPRMLKFQASALAAAAAANQENSPSERIDPRTRAAVQPVDTSSFGNSMVENNPYEAASNGADNGGSMELPVCCILIENMEYRTTEQEIAQWLMQNVNLAPIRIQLLVNNRNQTNGEAFIQFADNEQAKEAVTLHQTRFKSRSVRISLATWQQVQETLNRIHEILLANGFGGINSSNQNYSRDQNRGGGPNGRLNNSNSSNSNRNARMDNARNNSNHSNSDRCVVSLSNVPYKANIDDILDFFDDYDITPENVIRRYNDEGKPTGDARICFKSPMEARRAVDQKDKCRIMNRPIFLNIL